MKTPDELDEVLQPPRRSLRENPNRLYPGTAQIIDLARVRATQQQIRRPRRPQLGHRVVIAASLAIGALGGALLGWLNASDTLTEYQHGRLLARGALARALDQQLTGHATADANVRVGATYRTREGAYCRTFTISGSPMLAGLACRNPTRWQVQTLLTHGSAPALLLELNRNINGTPVAASTEAALRARDWH